jgi:hypothetical protein
MPDNLSQQPEAAVCGDAPVRNCGESLCLKTG